VKWREWKEWIEAHGVKDEDEIFYIDCSYPQDCEPEERETCKGKQTGWAIY